MADWISGVIGAGASPRLGGGGCSGNQKTVGGGGEGCRASLDQGLVNTKKVLPWKYVSSLFISIHEIKHLITSCRLNFSYIIKHSISIRF